MRSARRLPAWFVAFACAVSLVATACGGNDVPKTAVHLADPGSCAPVDVAAAPEIQWALHSVAKAFNASPQSHLAGGACAFVRIQSVDSAVAANRLLAGWPDPDHNGPQPAMWAPASSAWVALVNERRASQGQHEIATTGVSVASTPLVVAMPEPMARALGWPAKQIGWRDLSAVAANPQGWAAYGHPEWGAFRLGKPNPNWSTSGLLGAIALQHLGDDNVTRALEASVIYYGDASWPYLDNWFRLDKLQKPMSYVSAVVTDARSVTAYNEGSANGIVPGAGTKLTHPHVRLVALAPSDSLIGSDNPLVSLGEAWVTPAAREGAAAFAAFARAPGAAFAKTLTAAGLQPGGGSVDVMAAPTGDAANAVDAWARIRKPARLLVLFDVSDSMGDVSDPRNTKSETKISLAKRALLDALPQLAPDDEIGLRIFTTDLGGAHPNWKDVVPIGRLDHQHDALTRAINDLTPLRGSPLYSATHDAFNTVDTTAEAGHINGVIVMSDGYNETDTDNSRAALLAELHDPTRVFTIAYSPDADQSSLRKIAQSTNARVFDAGNPRLIEDTWRSAIVSF